MITVSAGRVRGCRVRRGSRELGPCELMTASEKLRLNLEAD